MCHLECWHGVGPNCRILLTPITGLTVSRTTGLVDRFAIIVPDIQASEKQGHARLPWLDLQAGVITVAGFKFEGERKTDP